MTNGLDNGNAEIMLNNITLPTGTISMPNDTLAIDATLSYCIVNYLIQMTHAIKSYELNDKSYYSFHEDIDIVNRKM